MAGTKRKAIAPKAKGKGKNGQVANEDTDCTIINQYSAPASPNTNPRERKLIVKFLFPGVGGRSRTTAERVPISTSVDQNPTVENSDKVSTTNSDASAQQANEDVNEQSSTFENSDTVSPPLKKIKFIIKKAKISTQPVEEDIKDENPTFENFDTDSPAVDAPKRPSQRKQESKLGPEKPEDNIKSVTDTLDATLAKSNTSAESLSAKKQQISPPQPTRKSKRVPRKSEKASADRTGSDKTDSPETGITEPNSDSETLKFCHSPP
ncbi:hypothetical protein DID88_001495 [Monilinia fructigena]|uniref:Uncharacterized protein n=1 Tax=Monilinia fructigena TaxID=38457 RepID=A0A395IXL5_9HELO|nr:hypothetical protein DID88_001495 [Monilinia fructigena]